jgi:outer membrane protein assembly factor BamB
MSATGQTSGDVGSATLVVSNNWDQWGNSPTKNAFELNDLALTDSVSASGRFYFDEAYNFPTFAKKGIQSTVAIDGGTAFFGDSAGDFWAINVSTSVPVWEDGSASNDTTYIAPANTIDSAGGIDSSAAVDPNLVIDSSPEPAVFFGTEADASGVGSVTAVNEDTGDVLWSTPTTSAVESSPALYDGVLYVGTDNGTFYALDEQTGAVEWTQTLAPASATGSPQSSPAIDTSLNHPSVVVGNGDDVTALNLTTGNILWTEATGGPVTATPIYFSNNIYIGSQDGTEYAFNGGSGATVWTFATGGSISPTPGGGGPIIASNVTFGTEIAVGSMNGWIYYLTSTADSSTPGQPDVANYLSPPPDELGDAPGIVGLSGAVNFLVATLANGYALATRITGIDQTWKYNGDSYGFASAPVVNNGNVYLTGLDGNMYVFSVPGRPVY